MQARFSIHVEPWIGIITITLSGFFHPEDAARYVAALKGAQSKLRTPPNEHVTLVDMREVRIQMQESVALFRQTMTNPTARSRRLALVTAGSLSRMQVERAAEGRGARFFTCVDEARTWLLEGSKRAA